MKVYQKPSCEPIVLKTEENIAMIAVCSNPYWVNNNASSSSGCWVTSGS